MHKPPLEITVPVTMQLEVFDPVLFSVGTPVAMMSWVSDWERMYWKTTYGLVTGYQDKKLTVIRIPYSDGKYETSTIHINYLDGKFYIVPLDRLVEELQEGKNEK